MDEDVKKRLDELVFIIQSRLVRKDHQTIVWRSEHVAAYASVIADINMVFQTDYVSHYPKLKEHFAAKPCEYKR